MNDEIHVVPIGSNAWAVEIGKISYQSFDSEEKAVAFGWRMASKQGGGCEVVVHDRDGHMLPAQSDRTH